MKALIFLSEHEVLRWYAEDGKHGVPTIGLEIDLAEWFRNGWKVHGGLPTNMNGGTLLVLRDGKPVDKWTAP